MMNDKNSASETPADKREEAAPEPAGEQSSTKLPGAPDEPTHQHCEELLDEALEETFPASDPITVPSFD